MYVRVIIFQRGIISKIQCCCIDGGIYNHDFSFWLQNKGRIISIWYNLSWYNPSVVPCGLFLLRFDEWNLQIQSYREIFVDRKGNGTFIC